MHKRIYIYVFVWLNLILASIYYMSNYMFKESVESQAPSVFPANNWVKLNTRKNNLVLFLHPHCPCSFATVNELKRVLARTDVDLSVVFIDLDKSYDLSRQELFKQVSQIKAAKIIIDKNNVMTKAFKVYTSGTILAYNKDGGLIFQGGITAGRGEEGDNLAKNKLVQSLKCQKMSQAQVFGCSLLDSKD